MQHSHEVSQSEIIVCNRTLNLMELCQVSGVQALVTEDSVDGEVLDWMKLLLLAQLIQHARCDCRGVGAKEVLLGFFQLPVIFVAAGKRVQF